MKIKNVSCTQFAGMRNKSISFDDGINLVYGRNESGKSTLVNLLSRTLFQNARLDGRSDREFMGLYFPGILRENEVPGDFADGKVTFEAAGNTYIVEKEWGNDAKSAHCSLTTPTGITRTQKSINVRLKEILIYGEGVYSDMLFSPQRNKDASLKTILDASKNTDARKEISSALAQAFSESDGITADAIEQAISAKMEEITGKHWDISKSMPVRRNGRWTRDLGEILKAYYDLEDAGKILEKIKQLETESDTATADYTIKYDEARSAEEAYDRFQSFKDKLILQNERRKEKDRLEIEIAEMEKNLMEWPRLLEDFDKANALEKEKKTRLLLNQFISAKELFDEINTLEEKVKDKVCPTESDISNVRTAQRKITTYENRLCGMNLSAGIKMLGENTILVTSLKTGQTLDITDSMSITEAVKITVPDVMEMQLSPANVNVSEIEAAIKQQKKIVWDIFRNYEVESLEELEELKNKITTNKETLKIRSERLSTVLGGKQYIELASEANAIVGEVRSEESIEEDILAVCGTSDITRFIITKEANIQNFVDKYGSMDLLRAQKKEKEEELKQTKESVKGVQDIPEEYTNITEPEKHLTKLKRERDLRRDIREEALKTKTAAVNNLESYKERLEKDPEERVKEAERIFEEKKVLLSHWMHISDVFTELRNEIKENPMQDLSDSFSRYLGIISGGKITSEFPEPEKLNMNIYSGDTLVDYGKLSEGTKETVFLAFRLAVLDHLFPDGGGVIVLDDPLTDMDAERAAQSCELIKECADRHQVIFLTCREEYADMLGGNEIRLDG